MSEIRSELESNPIYLELELDAECAQSLAVAAGRLLSNYFVLENPQLVHPIGLKLGLKAKAGDALLDGTIDRLDLDQNGGLTVTIYKTGRTPPPNYEQARLGDVQFYAFLCERLLGRLPARVQLLYLGEPAAIVTEPTAKTLRSAASQLGAVWQAVNRACERHDFRPHQSKLCEWCDFKSRCPEFGGDPHAG